MTLLNKEGISKILDKISAIGATAAWTIMAVLTFIDVVGRDIFSTPIQGGYEYIQFLMAVGVFFSLPIVALRKAHVKVELFRKIFPAKLNMLSDAIARLTSILFFGFFAYSLIRFTMHAKSTGVRTDYLSIPHWVVGLLMSIFLVMTTICCIVAREPEQRPTDKEEIQK